MQKRDCDSKGVARSQTNGTKSADCSAKTLPAGSNKQERFGRIETKRGGKKGKGGKGKEEEKKVIEHCAIFMAVDYAEWKKQVIEILSQFQFENNKIVGNHIPVIQEKLKGPNAGNAMKFAAFLLEEVAQ